MTTGNQWINGYLEAILDVGTGIDEHRLPSKSPLAREVAATNSSAVTKYFVEEVVATFDETDIHRTWMKASAVRNAQERSGRLENLCWRIWNLARKKKQIELEDGERLVWRQREREQGRKDAAEILEDLSEGEKVDAVEGTGAKMSRIGSFVESWPDQQKGKRLYIVLISVHGLVRGDNMELGRDSDTGGQVKYVVEFAKALAMMPGVFRVDLLTRQISSPDVDWSYGEPTEMLTPGCYESDVQEGAESSGAYIVRIPCGPRDQYIRKELLWPHIQEFVDGAIVHILNMAKVLGEQFLGGEPLWPHVIHGHYADAGDIAALLSGALNVPMAFTGHSLGRNKLDQLLKQGRSSSEEINATYKIMRRIEAEELSLDAAELVVTSTRQEIEQQWGLYDGFDVTLERGLRSRSRRGVNCHGRFMPRMVVTPPGMDFSSVVHDTSDSFEGDSDASADGVMSPRADPPIYPEIKRFFTNPHKPMILALARPDPKKNITTLLKAFGECRQLRELANLTLIMGNREDIDEMSGGNSSVLTTVLKLIDKYDLYGQVAYPKHHKQSDVPNIYRLAAKTKGVFINPALVEPFGLTLIEAAAHGLPMVATKNGGPVDIQQALNNGLLVDPHDQKAISDALLKLVADRNLWSECRRNGLKNIHLYSWPEHCRIYLAKVAQCRTRHPHWKSNGWGEDTVDADSPGDSLRDAHDISLRLSVDGERTPERVSLNGSATLQKFLSNLKVADGKDINVKSLKQSLNKNQEQKLQDTLEESEGYKSSNSWNNTNSLPVLRKRKRLFVIAVDYYHNSKKDSAEGLLSIIWEIFKVGRSSAGRPPGFVLSTALTISEIISILTTGGIAVHEFDAFICNSGSEIYYPSPLYSEESGPGSEFQLSIDSDYEEHTDYRWDGDGLRKTLTRLTFYEDETREPFKTELIFGADQESSSCRCLTYDVRNPSAVPKADQIRQKLRMRGVRCHAVYCKNATKLHILPLFASRSQALRYMFIRWGIEVANIFVFVGETGDTDHEELLSGLHKTIVLKSAIQNGSEDLLRVSGSYGREDVVPLDSPNLVHTEGNYSSETILGALRKLGY
ncbi:hypothetical protein O6H91_10G074800 [Diphasiastrum complanatum]|uniref:Uncharacterized protein n=1 Tax=Diphasiastrum complanatum TaxID=34168 RepID=A0ACC2CIF7_DIPCM|nr:hypothetical protein O6H91_10G074800 [Diphasiastrum complanatum]